MHEAASDALKCLLHSTSARNIAQRRFVNLLALETSTEYLSVALQVRGEITQREVLAGHRHAELILPMVEELLAGAGTTLSTLDGIAFASGPGAFTGLRIGCGVAQGLAFARDLPVIGIGTLSALAAGYDESRVIAAIDARMGEVYLAAYERSGEILQQRVAPCICVPANAPQVEGAGWTALGNAFEVYREALGTRYGSQVNNTVADARPTARAVLRLATIELVAGRGVDAALAAPFYIRDKVALTTAERRQLRAVPS